MTTYPQLDFERNVIRPVECLKGGWNLIKDQYWLFLGMTIVGMLIGSALPMAILLGPMMCGLYLTFFKKRRGEPIEFGILFKGFDYFGQAVIATLFHIIPIMAVVIPTYFLFYISFVLIAVTSANSDSGAAAGVAFFLIFAVFFLVLMLAVILISIGFLFAYPLIVDRRLSGFDAVKLSFRAAFANFWGLLGLMFLGYLLSIAGIFVFIIGVYLVVPVTYAAIAVAYEKVFGLADLNSIQPNLPPPPPQFT
ncbi:MAG TPA: hypothetical protein VLB68_32025 [Pyrinomonadaceae bacterium]|nr:hypothetical protein [Pyrinomonadaceae bacterium]